MGIEKPQLLKFHSSPDTGMAECICSMCRKPIVEGDVPVRAYPKDKSWEMRFHSECYSKIEDLNDYNIEWGDK